MRGPLRACWRVNGVPHHQMLILRVILSLTTHLTKITTQQHKQNGSWSKGNARAE